jgi:glycosyltransferase involved in cell wall biosynthesis
MSGKEKGQKPLRILLLGSQIATGGAQQVLLSQAEEFTRLGHAVTVVYFYDREGLYEHWVSTYPFPIIDLKARKKGAGKIWNLLALLQGFGRLVRLLRSQPFDVIETFTHHGNLLGLPAAAVCGVKTRIATHHGVFYGFPGWQRRIHTWLINSRITQKMVAISNGAAYQAEQEGIHKNKVVIIPNGVKFISPPLQTRQEIRDELGLSEDQTMILTVGRLAPEKAQTILFKAFKLVLMVFPTAVLVMVGDGPLRAELELLAQQLEIGHAVKFMGFRKDVPRWMASCDMFVLSSVTEGLPLVLLEAMSSEKPVISTQVGGIGEVIQDQKNGWLVPSGEPEALAQAMIKAIAQPELAQKLALAGRQTYLAHYTVEKMCQGYLAFFYSGQTGDLGMV